MVVIRMLGKLHAEDRNIDSILRSLDVVTESQNAGTRAEVRDDLMRNAVLHLQEKFVVQPVRMSYSHGDFAPWNVKRMPQGGLYIFDWEYAQSAPLLNDLTHFLFMHAHLVEDRSPTAVVAGLLNKLRSPLVAEYLKDAGIGRADIPAYLLLYLLGHRSQESTPTGAADGYIRDCIHHLLVRAEDARERPRVLVGAYACEPNKGSEPGVGWQMAKAISVQNEAWVITRYNNKSAIESALSLIPDPNLHFVYVDLPRWARFWKKGSRGVRFYYYLWQLRAWWEARRLCRQVSLDLAHHVTFVNDWLYTFLALLPLPFVWGPIGSHPPVPRPLAWDSFSLARDRLRLAVQKIVRLADPLYWMSLVRARLVVGIDRTVFERLPLRLLSPRRQVVHTAIGVETFSVSLRVRSDPSVRPFTVLSVGRFVPMKNFGLAIAAFARFAAAESRARMIILGDGPLKADLKEYARQLKVITSIEFRNWASREGVLEIMRQADVFLFPSTEGGGMVVLEALACGLPVVCLDYGGPGSMITDRCGVRVAPNQFNTCAKALGDALRHYSADPNLLRQHRRSAVEHATSHYAWQARPLVVQRWYRAVLHDNCVASIPRASV
jgi:glycosyltransferase involved in cell wall biosynthesis